MTLDADYYSPLKRNVLKRYVYLKEVLQADVMTSIPVSPPRRVRTPILVCPNAKEEENGCFGRSPLNALQLPVPIAVDDANVNESCGSGNGSCEMDLGNAGSLSGLGCLEKSESVVCQGLKSVPDALQKECVDGVNHDGSVHGDTPVCDKVVDDAVAEQDKPVAVTVSEKPVDAAKTDPSKRVSVVTHVQCKPVTATMPEQPVEIATTEQGNSIAVTTESNKPVTMSVPEKPVESATTEQNKPTATLSTKQSHPQPSPNHPPQNPSPPVTATTPPSKPSFFSLLFKWFHFFSPVS